ncbi:MAG: ABC transporter substrate-binding protein, partial [Clostridia bacterium]
MKRCLPFLLSLLLLCACSMPATAAQEDTYRTLYASEVTTLNYLYTASTNEFAVAANVIDTLVEYDRFGRVQPSLAERWETSADGLTWTFHLRSGAQWVDCQGNKVADVKAQDFVDAARYVLDGKNACSTANIMYDVIAGAKAYYDATSPAVEGEAKKEPQTPDFEAVGIKALDDATLTYTLVAPTPYFLSMVTYVCFMPVNGEFLAQQGENFGAYNDAILYNGAYILSTFEPQSMRVYTRNEAYWDKANVHIAEIEQIYNKEAATIAPEMFRRGEIDDASISSDILDDWMASPDTA